LWALAKRVANPWVPFKSRHFWTNRGTLSFLWRVLLNRVNTIQGVPGGKDNILVGHSIGHSKQKTLYEHVSYSERFPIEPF
jgi:hypothetical protein